MTTVLHVLDRAVEPAALERLRLLAARGEGAGLRQAYAALDGATRVRAAAALGAEVALTPARLGLAFMASERIRVLARRAGAQCVHAWGAAALTACGAAARERPLAVTPARYEELAGVCRCARQVWPMPAVVVGCQAWRRRCVEQGVALERTAVIRAAVDFAALNAARGAGARASLARGGGPVVLAAGPASRRDGQFTVLWAVAIVQQIHRGMRLIVPFGGSEARRLGRLAESVGLSEMLGLPGERHSWAALAAGADVLMLAPDEEAAPEPLAWGMAAGLGIVAPARRSISECIADRSNGLLLRDARPTPLAAALLRLVEDEPLRKRLGETARGQAYEVFSARACVEGCARMYENLAAGRAVGDGVSDTAMVA
ncbi:MAG: glycosyltransferase family 4 protein [Phycisphaerae bacterium]